MSSESFPLVSVLIPTHERPHYLALSLASVINQTYHNIEIIISDNSMGNETELIIEDFQKSYSNIHYFHSPGISAKSNWQTCWDNMSPESEYVNFLMDDDLFAPTKIECMINEFLKHPNLSLVTSYRKLIDKDGNLLPDTPINMPVSQEDIMLNGDMAGHQIVVNCTNWIGEPTTVLFKKECTNGFFGGWSGKEKVLDYPLWLRLLEQGDMFYIAKPLSFFRQHNDNATNEFDILNLSLPLSLAYTIQTAWNKKKYLTTTTDLRKTLFMWCRAAIVQINNCYERNYEGEDFNELLRIFDVMSSQYVSKAPTNIEF